MHYQMWGDKTTTVAKTVNGNTTDWTDVIVPNGETWVVRGAEAAGPDLDGTNMAIVWDRTGTPEVLFLSYGTSSQAVEKSVVGNGTKRLSIRLQNKSLLALDLFCRYHAEKVNV
jgi:hypothetical protein